jgi:hypothetical protein
MTYLHELAINKAKENREIYLNGKSENSNIFGIEFNSNPLSIKFYDFGRGDIKDSPGETKLINFDMIIKDLEKIPDDNFIYFKPDNMTISDFINSKTELCLEIIK